MSDNTTTSSPSTLTPELLRQALHRWCEEQSGVLRLLEEHPYSDPGYQFFGTFPDYKNEKRWWFFAEFNETEAPHLPVVELRNAETFLALTALAIEHQYIPWLKLAATLPYTGAEAARLALGVLREPTKAEEEERRVQDEAMFWAEPLTDDGAMGWD